MSDIKNFSKNLKKALDDAKKDAGSRQSMQRLGNSIADDIRKRTQLGFGVQSSGKKREKLLKLADSTKKQRAGKLGFWTNNSGKVVPVRTNGDDLSARQIANNKQYLSKTRPNLSSNTTASKSNLTQTGRMLKSIGVLVTGLGKASIGFRTDYGARIASFVSKARPFFFMTNNETLRAVKKIDKVITDSVNKAVRKYFK